MSATGQSPAALAREQLPGGTPADRLAALRRTFESGQSLPLKARLGALGALLDALKRHEPLLLEALHRDLGKSPVEAYFTEIGLVRQEIRYLRHWLPFWMRPRWRLGSLVQQPGWIRIRRAPYGVVLVIAPWNFPVLLSLLPLAGALAAGNAVALKPSELAPNSAGVLRLMLESAFSPDYVAVFEGGPELARALLELRWDYVFFTGGPATGRFVYEAAARHLTPCTLELGGKSPCVVDAQVELQTAARRIAWGKFLNAGQVCLAPDYVLVDRRLYEAFLEALVKAIRALYGDAPQRHPDYGRIVNEQHFARLVAYLRQGRVYYGGQLDASERYIAPTVLVEVPPEAPVMQEEIFGPILPVLPYENPEEAVSFLRSRPDPLALYVFSRNPGFAQRLQESVRFGGGCVNDVVLQLASPRFPFGGIGQSGLGRYRGKASWECFTYEQAVLLRPFAGDVRLRYPPYEAAKRPLFRRLLR
ncbi:MAG: aldehyde dehydrogenase family protein [Bacteroidetes bacterium]|nr:aldehyde dehydrogenase family protein [Rhodothermia bacterium]MCS7154466.1 aldehyde dehydrogenase family protein [Bacteroidota bacterium]MCX7906839.1 aldehyde dehydrogenase family protein [Bacteroidota bacterium]MDW8136882.1 aldehyde dehydrogenase family protein [Bacteroidota bacterium]MDW8285248.1 aldehyde dehydrogenase family protein [Bacteroidota bacterium]